MDHVADISKYTDSVDAAAVAGMEKTYRLVLSRSDTALVAWSDPEELETVKRNFLKKKLGLTESDDKLDAASAVVGAKMKDGTRNSRIAVYYLLAE